MANSKPVELGLESGTGLDGAIELAPGMLRRLGGYLELDGRITWFPTAARGFSPCNAFLFTTEAAALLIDPGLPVIADRLVTQLRGCVGDAQELSILITRPAEFDCISNVGAVLSAMPVTHVYSIVQLHQFVGFLPRFDLPPAETDTSWPLDTGTDWPTFVPGDTVEVDPARPGDRTLELVRTPLRMLATTWIYDAATRTLFTSDSFNHVRRAGPRQSPVLRESDRDTTTVAEVREQLLAKLDWLDRADTTPLREGVEAIFAEREIDTVAPAHGCILQGRAVVERHFELLLEAFAEISRHARVRAEA